MRLTPNPPLPDPVTAENEAFELVSSEPEVLQLLKVHPTRPSRESMHLMPGPTLQGFEKVVLVSATNDPLSTSIPATVAPAPVMVPLVLTENLDPPMTLIWEVPADTLADKVDISQLLPLLTSNGPPELSMVRVPSAVILDSVRLITGAPVVPRTVLLTLMLVLTASTPLISTI